MMFACELKVKTTGLSFLGKYVANGQETSRSIFFHLVICDISVSLHL